MPETILVWNVSGIGDFVDSTPALRALRARCSSAQITLAVSEKVFPLAASCPHADVVMAFPTMRGRSLPGFLGVPRWVGRMLSLRGRFSQVVHLYEVHSRLGARWVRMILAWLAAPVTVGRNTEGRAPFFTHPVEERGGAVDNVDRFLQVVSAVPSGDALWAGGAESQALELWIPPPTVRETAAWLESEFSMHRRKGPRVLVFLGGDRRTRHDPADHSVRWVRALQEEFDARLVLWGMAKDPGLAGLPDVVDARGRWGLLQSSALFACVDVVVTTHSSPQHLAGVWDVPTVVLAGPGDTAKYRPHIPSGRTRILRHPVPCAPCYYDDCPWPGARDRECLRGISVEAIVEAVREVTR